MTTSNRWKLAQSLLPVALLVAVLVVAAQLGACGSDGSAGLAGDQPDGSAGHEDSGSIIGNGQRSITKVEIDPPTASITSINGAKTTQAFKLIATYDDNTKSPVTTDVAWTASNAQVGTIDGTGLYTASGSVGGAVRITASHKSGSKASAQLTVKLVLQENPGSVPGATQAALKAATTADASVVWNYPYDGTVFPRGLAGPRLMWNGGLANDAYYVSLKSPTFELESFATVKALPSRYAFTANTWQRFVDSSEGTIDMKVARFSNGTATVVASHKWKIAPASMRGTIYYWANNSGRVMRIKPGATAPDDFSVGVLTPQPPNFNCTMTCHTVSADGSTLVSGGDILGGTYDLIGNKWVYDTVGQPGQSPGGGQKRLWAMPALTPDGKYLVQNASDLPGPPGGQDGLYVTANGAKMTGTGLEGMRFGMPAFSPDGTRLVWVGVAGQATPTSLRILDFDMKTQKGTGSRELLPKGTGAEIGFPSVSPDAKWIVYHRGPLDTRNGNADMFLASAVTPGTEVRLAALNGDTYPFAAGARDKSWQFEPTFAPVAAGGYFWVVFTSRRTYGNVLTGAKADVKQLWVAAIDQNPTQGQDPSHAAFWLPGQLETTLNMRGYWALDPCKGDGQGCTSGTECCGGYCDGTTGDGGGPVCKSQKTDCAQNGDRCDLTADCCNASQGVTCINHVCSEPPPR